MKKNKLLLILFALFAFGQTAWAQTNVNYIDADGEPQTASAYLITSSSTSLGLQGYDIWYYVTGNVEINSQVTYISNINLILCDGASLTINTTDEDAIHCSANNLTLTIYGQTSGTGQLTATATSSSGIYTEYFTIHGGVINASGSSNGIYANKTLVINRGTVTANGNDWGMRGDVVTINGGNVTANGGGIWSSGMTSTLTIGYTNNSDRIYSTKYKSGYTGNMMRVKSGQYMKTTDSNFIIYGKVNDDWKDAIAGHTLMPYTPTEWSGSGTAQSPYIISSIDDLNLLSIRTNGGTHPYSDTCFKLGANITFTASSDWNDASSTESNFTAIPTFSGHFDGDVYTISGLRIRKDYGVGLFNYLADGAVVEKITLSNSRITGVSENGIIGGIVGSQQSGATVNNCHVTNTVYVYSGHHYTGIRGGVVGYNYGGTISNCVSEATIGRTTEVWDNTDDKAGGIVGVNASGTLSGNLVIGANITCKTENYGAIAGLNDGGTLTNNYYRACTINGTTNATGVGCNGADVTTNDGALSLHTITKPNDVNNGTSATLTYNNTSYWAQGKNITLSGGLNGTPTEGWQKAYCINDVALQENSTTIKNNFDMPATDVTITIREIHADWAISNAGSQADPYKIYFNDQLDLLATRVNAGNNYSGKYFKLMDDLTYDNTEQNNYIAIGTGSNPFSGHFDGNYKTVEGIRIYTNGGYLGVFGNIVNAEVQNLYVNDIEITAHDHVGCIVGECDGSTVTGCRVTTATLSNTGGSYSDCSYFGGIAGYYMGASTMSNNFVLEADIPHVYQFGAIAGFVSSNQSLESNYYHNCFKDGTASPTGIGCNTGDVTTNDGAIPVFTVSVPDGVTASDNATVTHNSVNYYKKDVTVTLSGGLDGSNPNPGLQNAYVVYGETLIGSNLAPGHEFNMHNANAVVTIGSMPADWAVANEGTQADPYKIYFTDQLDLLATRVSTGNNYSGKYFKLMDDLTYDNTQQNNYIAIGTNANPFKGHFNGNHKTVNGIRIYGTGSYQGVFGYIVDAELKDLYVNDIVIAGLDRVGCIVGECDGSTTITDCRVTTATLNVTGDSSYQQLFGGIAGRKSGSTMSNNFVLGITMPQVYHTGAIAGENGGSSQSLISNYYYNCTVGGTVPSQGIGCNAIDVEGAKAVFTLTLAEDISTDVTPAVVYNTADYYENGATINLSYVTQPASGYEHIYSVNGTPIEGDSFNMVADANVTIVPDLLIDWATKYTGDDEEHAYLISNVEQWNMFANRVNGTNGETATSYSGKFFKLMEDISVTNMVGTSSNKFSGTFDGNGQTLTFNQNNATEQYIAPFRYINSATIQNLKVAGTVTSSNKFAGGVVAHAVGTNNTITNCVNSTIINATISGNGSHGGILGQLGGSNNSVTISGCLFNGKMMGANTDYWCGIIGYFGSNSVTINDCFFNPEEINVKTTNDNYTICRSGSSVNNCYYNTEAAEMHEKQGQLAHSITTNNENISIGIHGVASSETNIGVIGYNPGIKYDGVHYAASGETVSLLLDYTEPGYDASHYYANGTEIYLSPSFNSYPLTMQNADVVITADVILTTIYRQIEGYGDGDGKWAFIASPVSGSITPLDVTNLIGNAIPETDPVVYDFDLYRLNPSNTMWENYHAHTSDFNIVNGMGYLYATKTTKTLAFNGTLNTGTSKDISDLPAGFNLVGNPFTVDAYVSKPYYTLNSDGSAILTETSSNAIPPCYGIIVEVNENETVRFNTTGVFSTGPNNGGLNVALTQANTRSNAVMDNAIVSFNDGSELGKFYFGHQNANIYIPQGGDEYAIAFSDKHGEMPLNFKATKNGAYTLTVNPENIEMAYLHLIDNLTGNDVDLLQTPSYTFTGKTSDYASRFRLVFMANQNDNENNFAFIDANGDLIVDGSGIVQIIDLMGRVLVTRDANDRISADRLGKGVYVLRLINGDNVKTQKIVVK